MVNLNYTPGAQASQPRKLLYHFNRALNQIDLKQFLAVVEQGSGAGRPASYRGPLVRAYLLWAWSESSNCSELKWVCKKASLWHGLGHEAENDVITPLVRQLCGFPNSVGSLPSYDTFCRVSRQLEKHCPELLDAACSKLSQSMADLPWLLKGASEKGKGKSKGKGKRKRKKNSKKNSNGYVKKRLDNAMSLQAFNKVFPDNEAATAWLVAQRWPEGERCPKCGIEVIQQRNTRACTDDNAEKPLSPKQPYRCSKCLFDFSVKTGTVLHSSNLPCLTWVTALYLLLQHGGLSALKLAEALGLSYKSALVLSHRIRVGCLEDTVVSYGTFQFDEAYFGGRRKNQHNSLRKLPANREKKKVAVIGSLKEVDEDSGKNTEICLKILQSLEKEEFEDFVHSVAELGSKVQNDGNKGYQDLWHDYEQSILRHSAGEYVKDGDTTNSIESVWSSCKRIYYGVYGGHVSLKYFSLFLGEMVFRWNHRGEQHIFRMELVARNLMRRSLTQEDIKQGEGLVLATAEKWAEHRSVQGELIFAEAESDGVEAAPKKLTPTAAESDGVEAAPEKLTPTAAESDGVEAAPEKLTPTAAFPSDSAAVQGEFILTAA